MCAREGIEHDKIDYSLEDIIVFSISSEPKKAARKKIWLLVEASSSGST